MGFEITDAKTAAVKIKALTTELELISSDVQVRVRSYPAMVALVFRNGHGEEMASFQLVQQTNCCGLLISTKSYVTTNYQGKGIAQSLMPLKEAIAKEFGYGALGATVNMTGNPIEVHILTKCGWTKGWEFRNPRTNNQVGFFFKELT